MATNSYPVATKDISLVKPCTIPLTGVLRYSWTPGSPAPWGFIPEVRIALMGTTVPGAALNVYFDPKTGRASNVGNSPAPRYSFSFLPSGTQPSPTVGVAGIVGDTFINLSSVANLAAYADYSIGAPDTNLTVYRFQTPSTYADISTGGAYWQSTAIVTGDCVYFGGHATLDWNHIKHVVNAAAATLGANLVMIWEYSKGSGVWGDLTSYLTGDQTDFSKATPTFHLGCLPAATGTIYTGWRSPSDWAADTVNSVSQMWIRCRCVTGHTIGTPPTTNAQYTGRLFGDTEWRKLLNIATLTAVPMGNALEYAHGTTHVIHPANCYPGVMLDGSIPYDIIIGNTAATGSPIIAEITAVTVDSYLNQ